MKFAMAETVPKHEIDLTDPRPCEERDMAEKTRTSTIVSSSTEGPRRTGIG